MEEIISDMNDMGDERQGVDDGWITAFGESIGIRRGEPAKPAQDPQAGRIFGQSGKVPRCKYCNKPMGLEQGAHSPRQPWRCKECIAEALISLEGAGEVIGSCLCVLDEVYGLKIEPPALVLLRHGHKKEPVRIETTGVGRGLKQVQKLFKKISGQGTGQKTVSIGYGVSRVRVIESYLEACFQAELQRMRQEGRAAKENRGGNKEQRANGEAGKDYNDAGKGGAAKEGEPDKPNALRAWLVANCLYTMGELLYAQQYIADYQEQEGRKALDGINSAIGIPWNVKGRELMEIVGEAYSK